jgi:hypothetical protein
VLRAHRTAFGGGIGIDYLPIFSIQARHRLEADLLGGVLPVRDFQFKCDGRRSFKRIRIGGGQAAQLLEKRGNILQYSFQRFGVSRPDRRGAAVAWAYQTASARLGVVDLFACEISTLCRVGTLFDIGKRYVEQYDTPPPEKRGANDKRPAGSASFVSQEDYFPVFSNNARDLQVLEASVVNNITAFYTYMKAMRDSLRKLAEIEPPRAATPKMETPHAKTELDPWHAAITNVIYAVPGVREWAEGGP